MLLRSAAYVRTLARGSAFVNFVRFVVKNLPRSSADVY